MNLLKNYVISFYWICYTMKILLFAVFLHRVCPSFPPVWVFSWNLIIRFLWILPWWQKPLLSCAWQPNFLEKLFLLQKLGKWAKIRFFNLKKKLVINFHWICSRIKMFIFCVLAQILYLGKILFLIFRPKCSQPIRLHGF